MWLLEASIRQAIQQAQQAGLTPNAEQLSALSARHGGNDNRLLTIAGDVAEISIIGVMTQTPSFLAFLFGGGNTTYPDIIAALAVADADESVDRVELRIDSPGGSIDGLFETLAAIELFSKPLKAVVTNQAASAAFAIAAKADNIVANNHATRFGSVGIVATFHVDESEVTVTSTQAPKKRPDVTTEEGIAMVREELDPLHDIFVEAIADGRGITTDKVNAEFGQGGMFLAGEALKRGMIDLIAGTPLTVMSVTKSTTATTKGGKIPEKIPMDLNTLKADHRDLYEAVVQEGELKERDRTTAHLIMGVQSGAVETAIEACKDGSVMTATLQATYMTAGMNRQDVNNRQADEAEASGADGANAETTVEAEAKVGADILSMAAASCGVELGAV